MTEQDIQIRLNRLLDPYWEPHEFLTWYGVDLNNPDHGTKQLLAQATLWSGTFEEPSDLGAGPYNHWHWERFLQRREIVPITKAAAQLAMTVDQFRNVVERFQERVGYSAVGSPWANGSNCIVRRSFLRDFHKGFESTRRTIFANHPAYIYRVTTAIQSELGVSINPLRDLTDVKLETENPRPSYYIDDITNEPMGLGHEVFLDTGKPIELAPDACSWLTFANNEAILRPKLFGDRPGLTPEIIAQLR